MSDISPIEILLDLKPEDVGGQAAQIEKSLKNIDVSSEKARTSFKKFLAEQQNFPNKVAKGIKNVRTQYNGLNNSINQITRELPAFTYNVQTGFLAISNNLPILADSIANLRRQNAELVASGQKGTPIWKQLAGSLFSWNTAISIGITLLTVYGKEVVSWIGDLVKADASLSSIKRRIKAVNEAFEKPTYTKASINILKLKADFESASKGVITKERALNNYNKTVGKVMGTVDSFAKAEKKLINQGDEYVRMMLYKAAALASLDSANKEIIENEKKKLEAETELQKAKTALADANRAVARSIGTGRASEAAAIKSAWASGDVGEAKREVEKAAKKIAKVESSAKRTYNSLISKAKDIAKKFNFNLFGNENIKGSSKKITSEYEKLIKTLKDLDTQYSKQTFDKDKQEVQALEQKFAKVRKLIETFNKNPKNKLKISLAGLNDLQVKATESLKYRQRTQSLVGNLEKEQELYQAYEAFKTEVGVAEAQKRHNLQYKEYRTYLQRLQGEIDKVNEEVVTPESAERLQKLQALVAAEKERQSKQAKNKFAEAYKEAVTYEERKSQLIASYEAQRLELSKITDKKLQEQKKQALKQQHEEKLDKLNSNSYEQALVMEKLSQNLLGITKKELQNRIESLEQYLANAKDVLTVDQEKYIRSELKRAKAVQATTDLGVRERVLLEQRERILQRIAKVREKGNANVQNEVEELERVNGELSTIFSKKATKIADIAGSIGTTFSEVSSSVRIFDEYLADSLDTMGELSNLAGDIVSSIGSFASGNILGGITGVFSPITKVFSLAAKARESERKAREEIKKWHDELIKNQLAYNSEVRKQLKDEIKINDLYKSRVENIKEEISINKKNAKNILKDQDAIFKRLLKAQTITGKQTYKTGGFLGLFKKTKVANISENVAKLLGIGKWIEASDKQIARSILKLNSGLKNIDGKIKIFQPGEVELTDEIFKKLEKLNAEKPLTGDAKTAYSQLKKLRDEYGSIEAAQRELQRQLKDAVTGTTAKSLADSIKQGIASGKRSFADFADDIEGFLRQAMLAGMSTKIIEPQMQKLQDQLYSYLGDGVLTDDEKKQFQKMYLKVVEEAKQYANVIDQAGIGLSNGDNTTSVNSLKGAYKTVSQESIDLLAGQTGGFRLTQSQTNQILKGGFAQQLQALSKQVEVQQKIERNTRKTAENTAELKPIRIGIEKLTSSQTNNVAKANGF